MYKLETVSVTDQHKHLVMNFDHDNDDKLVGSFITVEGYIFWSYLLNGIESVFKGKNENYEFQGNAFGALIRKDFTIIYDRFKEKNNTGVIATEIFKELVEVYSEKNAELNKLRIVKDDNDAYLEVEPKEGYRTFFPDKMDKQDIVDEINDAYKNKKHLCGHIYEGVTEHDLVIRMYLDDEGKIVTAFPVMKFGE